MPATKPGASLARALRPLLITRPITDYMRISLSVHRTTPLGMGTGPSRFSPGEPRRSHRSKSFTVLYLAEDLPTALYETVVRHELDYQPHRTLMPSDYALRVVFSISTAPGSPLKLLDLTDGNAVRFGVPTDVLQHSQHEAGQPFSEFVYDHMPDADAILYHSRFTGARCVAVFDRGTSSLVSDTTLQLTQRLVGHALRRWNIDVY